MTGRGVGARRSSFRWKRPLVGDHQLHETVVEDFPTLVRLPRELVVASAVVVLVADGVRILSECPADRAGGRADGLMPGEDRASANRGEARHAMGLADDEVLDGRHRPGEEGAERIQVVEEDREAL